MLNRPQPHSCLVLRLLQPLALSLLLACAAVGVSAQTPAAAAAPAAAASAPTLRPEVAKPLIAAQEAVKTGKHTDALARIAEAEAVPALTPYENYILLRLKAPATFGNGDQAGALAIFEKIVVSPLLPAAEKPSITESAIKLALQLKQYERASAMMKTYLADGGPSEEIKRLYPQALSVLGDHAAVIGLMQAQVAADQAAQRATPEAALRLLAGSQSEVKDSAGYLLTLEALASSTGKPEYWVELTSRTLRRPGFAEERLMLDLYRLRRAVGVPATAGELGDMAHRANQAGLPAEAQLLLDAGFASGLLGKDANAAVDLKLRDAATKAAAQDRATVADSETGALRSKEGNASYGLGMALSGAGNHERALALINQGLVKGGLRRPDDVQLHLGVALWRAGKIAEAKTAFSAVKGTDGGADLARLWLLFLNSPTRK